MISPSMKKQRSRKPKKQLVAGLFLQCAAAVMGCFFASFRAKNPPTPTPSYSSSSPSSSSSEVMIKKRNRLSSLMIPQSVKEEECTNLEDKDHGNCESGRYLQAHVVMKELGDEANLFEACGSSPESSTEIQEIDREGKCQLNINGVLQNSKLNPWLDVIPTEKLNVEKKQSQPLTPSPICEEPTQGNASFSILDTGTITISSDEGDNGEQNAMTFKIPDDEDYKSVSVVHGRKSVRFYFDTSSPSAQNLSPEIDGEISKDLGAADISNILRPDPYPTPLKLNDEMQTPGTVFSAYQDGMEDGKKTRIRSQYVKSVLYPVENLYQWQGMQAEVSEFRKLSVELEESLEDAEERQSLSDKELNVESDKDSWIQENVTNQDDNHSTSLEKVPSVQILMDQAIPGSVSSHLNDSPKSWDFNGIPNSTSKYKEDQMVSFHSTPFVDRLEKALSEDIILPHRKKPRSARKLLTEISGLKESDTSLSNLQSSVNIQTIASC